MALPVLAPTSEGPCRTIREQEIGREAPGGEEAPCGLSRLHGAFLTCRQALVDIVQMRKDGRRMTVSVAPSASSLGSSELALAWRARGSVMDVLGHRVFYVDTGGDGPPMVLLHGYPTSSFDYAHGLDTLARRHRVIVHDHVGFGFSDKPRDYDYRLTQQADVALALWKKLGIESGSVVAHDYGTSVATELLARHLDNTLGFDLRHLTLSNGSMHIELSVLRPMQRLLLNRLIGPVVARLSTAGLYARNIRRLFADPTTVSDEELDAMWQMLIAGGGRAVLPKISQYYHERWEKWDRWVGALRKADVPVHVVWATEDPVAVVKMAHVLHEEIPTSKLTLIDGVGHFPMIEAPERWTQAVLSKEP